jgi:hypothetical protein
MILKWKWIYITHFRSVGGDRSASHTNHSIPGEKVTGLPDPTGSRKRQTSSAPIAIQTPIYWSIFRRLVISDWAVTDFAIDI